MSARPVTAVGAPPPPEATLAWTRDALGPDSTIVAVRLMGISSTTMHAVDVLDGAGGGRALALRRFHDAGRLAADPWYSPGNEAAVLGLLDGTGVPAPR